MKNTTSYHRDSRSVSWNDCEQWLDSLPKRLAFEAFLTGLNVSSKDLVVQARIRLLCASASLGQLLPASALRQLGELIPVFQAQGLLREVSAAKLETAQHLVELGCPDQAVALLSEVVHLAYSARAAHAAEALRAVALLDTWRGLEAVPLAVTLCSRLLDAIEWEQSNLSRRALLACADVLLAVKLYQHRGLRTVASKGMSSGPVMLKDAGLLVEVDRLLPRLMAAMAHAWPEDSDTASLGALYASLAQPERALALAQQLTRRMSAGNDAPASAWLRLCTAYRLTDRAVLAANCASTALKIALERGSTRLQYRALIEAAHIRSDAGQVVLGPEDWHLLQVIDRQTWQTRVEYGSPADTFQAPFQVASSAAARPASSRALHVETALEKLRAQPGAGWRVDTLAAQCSVSRRTLEQAFRLRLGQSVASVIRDHRIQFALKLLKMTDYAIKRVALEAGFTSASALCRELQAHTGLTPRAVRLQLRRGEPVPAGASASPSVPAQPVSTTPQAT